MIDEDPAPDSDQTMLYRTMAGLETAALAQDIDVMAAIMVDLHDDLARYLSQDVAPADMLVMTPQQRRYALAACHNALHESSRAEIDYRAKGLRRREARAAKERTIYLDCIERLNLVHD